jgi:hypothetical protein
LELVWAAQLAGVLPTVDKSFSINRSKDEMFQLLRVE